MCEGIGHRPLRGRCPKPKQIVICHTKIRLAETPLFMRMVVIVPVSLDKAAHNPFADVKVAVEVFGKRC